MNKYGKFAILVVLIIGTLVWLAMANMGDAKTYYKTVAELTAMGDRAYERRLRVAGDVEEGTIVRERNAVRFTLLQEGRKLNVVYTGSEPVPDTFKGGAQALADGKLGRDGVFQASKIQAKCASKYEAKPGQPGQKPLNERPSPKVS